MKPQSVLCVLLLGTLFCVFYFENCNATTTITKPATVPAAVAESQKPGNTTVSVPPSPLSRTRRQACHGSEPPGHRCSNDCHCARNRYCSSYGYCHARNRNRRLSYSEDVEEQEYNEAQEY